MTLIIDVIGSKKSGKTTTIEFLIRTLTREGYRVAALKHVHHAGQSFDMPGKDTYRFAEAGSPIVVGISPDRVAIFKTSPPDLNSIIASLQADHPDLILLEGFHSLTAGRRKILKIITAKDESDAKRLMKGSESVIAITGLIGEEADETLIEGKPVINLRNNRASLTDLVRPLLQKK